MPLASAHPHQSSNGMFRCFIEVTVPCHPPRQSLLAGEVIATVKLILATSK
jgi:hypothetical protein